MPLTFSHPAATMLLKNKRTIAVDWLPFILGTMAPDFEYFLYFAPKAVIGHSVEGFLTINLLLCFAVAYLIKGAIGRTVLTALPEFLRMRLVRPWHTRKPGVGVCRLQSFAVWAIFGMITHVAWDSFTHSGGAMVALFTVLSQTVNIAGHHLPVYKFLQHGSTLLGGGLIAGFVFKLPKTQVAPSPLKLKGQLWATWLLCATLIFIGRYALTASVFSLRHYGVWIVTALSSGVFAWVPAALLFGRKTDIYPSLLPMEK